jgi:hypothetical protein
MSKLTIESRRVTLLLKFSTPEYLAKQTIEEATMSTSTRPWIREIYIVA